MKLERLPEYLTVAVVMTLGVIFAVWSGRMTGAGQFTVVLGIIAAGFLLTCIVSIRTKVWLAIPLLWDITGKISALPVPLSIHDSAILVVLGSFLVFIALKLIRDKAHYEFLDFLMFFNLLYLATEFIRNPVGIEAFGSDLVGGRPYFSIVIALIAYWILSRAWATPGEARIIPLLMVAGGSFVTLLSVLSRLFPPLIPALTAIYSAVDTGVDSSDLNVGGSVEGEGSRLTFLVSFGSEAVNALAAYFRPITLINPLYFFRFLAFSFSFLALLLSGHRMNVVGTFGSFFLCTYFRRRTSDMIKLAVWSLPLLAIVVIGQGTLYDLPYSVQRSLTFLPGNWDPEVVEAAHGSLEWRWDMWRWALQSDQFIKDKIWGDGFGFSRQQYQEMLVAQTLHTEDADELSLAISGGFHNGPLSAIRFVGCVGLVLFYLLMYYAAREAGRVIRRAEGTPFFFPALFFGCALIFQPFAYTFLYGAYGDSMEATIFGIGMLKMLKRSMDLAKPKIASPVPPVSYPTPRPLSPIGALAR